MDRRSALFLTLLGGLVPRRLLAQSTSRRASTRGRTRVALEPARSRGTPDVEHGVEHEIPADQAGDPAAASEEESHAGLPPEPGQQWRNFDISGYVGLPHNQNTPPQNAIIEWIFRRTNSGPWHGDKIAVLCASRTQVRAYHNASVLKTVGEMVDRFTDATHDFLSLRVRFVAAVDTRWRYAVHSRLNPILSGPQGQQVWTLKVEDSAFVLSQMQVYQGFKLLTDRKIEMINGQKLMIKTSEPRTYTGGLQRESAAGLGLQPRTEQLEEGVTLHLSPLLEHDGDTIEAAIDLTANTVKSLHRTRVIAPREVGPSELTIDVPEVVESRLNKIIKGWPVGQTLLISAGIQPGILQSKTGFMNLRLPGTVPTTTELLVFIECETVSRGRDRDREARDSEG